MVNLVGILWTTLRAASRSRRDLALENVALQQQLSVYNRASKRPGCGPRIAYFGSDCPKSGANGEKRSLSSSPTRSSAGTWEKHESSVRIVVA